MARVSERVDLPASLDAPGKARNAIRRALRDHLPPERLAEVQLVASELVANSVRHAGLEEHGKVELRLGLDRSHVRLEVLDGGPGFDPPSRRDAGVGGGYGLVIVDRLATRWGIDRGGTVRVWVEIDL